MAKLTGLSFCFTGTLSSMTRDEAVAKIESLGGRYDKNPMYYTTYLVTGDKPGAVKVKQGKTKGCQTMKETEFMSLIKAGAPVKTYSDAAKESVLGKSVPVKAAKPEPIIKPTGVFESRDW